MKRYKIGVDARILSEQITGIGRYAYEVLRRLVNSEHRWIFYSHRPLIIGEWNQPNVKVISGNYSGRLARMIWAQTSLPILANIDKLDLFWSPSHRLPALLGDSTAKVVTIHDLVWKHSPETMRPTSRFLDSILMPAAILKADQLISVSTHTSKDICKLSPSSRGKINIIPLGATKARVSGVTDTLQKLGIRNKYILFVGTLEPRKNLTRLLIAYSMLSVEEKNRAHLLIVGGKGWGKINLEELISRLNLAGYAKLLGYVDECLLEELYKNASFLAMPSLYEGFGLPLIEAISRGVPVLTSDCASMPEVAGSAGLYVDPHSVASIKDGLSLMINDDTLRNNLRENCANVSLLFDWDRTAEETLKAFERAVLIRRSNIRF